MPTYAELAVELLEDSASFFQRLGDQNQAIQNEMNQNAAIYIRLAETLKAEPMGSGLNGQTYGALAAQLLRDTASFMRKLGTDNAPIREQMEHNAKIYEKIATLVVQNPLGNLD